MFEGLASTYVAECEQTYRHTVVYPAAARRAQLEHELQQVRRNAPPRAGRVTSRQWPGAWLLRLTGRRPPAAATGSVSHSAR
jgi:hypothetical protein